MNISRLEKVPLRRLWPHEAHGFTKWLAENLDILNDTIGIQLSLVEREASAGPFSADILAEDLDGNQVVIENQLEKTDHDHLGKLITYMSNLETKVAIWITSEPRPEHEKAIHWLNETLPVDTAFFLIKLEAYQIDDSVPAPLFTIIAGPSVESKQIGEKKKELAERHLARLEFWGELLEKAKSEIRLHENISPSKDNWVAAGAGKSGLAYNYVILMDSARIEISLNHSNAKLNHRNFEKLHAMKDEIETRFGNQLEWDGPVEKKTARISYPITSSGLSDRGRWTELQAEMIEAMRRFHSAINPYIT